MNIAAVDMQNLDQLVSTLTLAFATDPVARWFYPENAHYMSRFPALIQGFGKEAFEHGSARVVDGGTGAALWLPPSLHPDEDALGHALQHDVSENVRGAAAAMFEEMAAYHPSEPHWYLPLLGVDPVKQGQGYGSFLLQDALDRGDKNHEVFYLESTNPRNVPLYQRYGFEVLGEIQKGNSPIMIPMRRPAY